MTDRSELPPIEVGAVLELQETDYIFGAGPLKLRVMHIPDEHETLGGGWMCLHGREIDWRGVEIQSRKVMVRVPVIERHLEQQRVSAHGTA
jgi:hypothetical protein